MFSILKGYTILVKLEAKKAVWSSCAVMMLPAPRYHRQRRHHREEQYARQCTTYVGAAANDTPTQKGIPTLTVQYNNTVDLAECRELQAIIPV